MGPVISSVVVLVLNNQPTFLLKVLSACCFATHDSEEILHYHHMGFCAIDGVLELQSIPTLFPLLYPV